jgi:hypothetical protein
LARDADGWLGFRHGRIELDEHVAGLDALPVADVDRANSRKCLAPAGSSVGSLAALAMAVADG